MIWSPRPSGPKPHKALGPRSPSWERGEGRGGGGGKMVRSPPADTSQGVGPTSSGDGMVSLWRPSSLQEGNRGSSPWWLCRSAPVKSIGERGKAHTGIARNRSNCKIEQKKKGREGKTHGLPPPEAIPHLPRGPVERGTRTNHPPLVEGGGKREHRGPWTLDHIPKSANVFRSACSTFEICELEKLLSFVRCWRSWA